MDRKRRKVLTGRVVADKMRLTATVEVETRTRHPLYKKLVIRHKNYLAHNDLPEPARVGDRVRITETRPLSARKRWRISRIVERAK